MYFFLFFIYLIFSTIVLIYWTIISGWFPRSSAKNFKNSSNINLAIIICAKNEAQNIEKCLRKVCTQSYDPYKVIVVNDYSTDDTQFILNQLSNEFPHLKVIMPSQDVPGKKLGITEAIQQCDQELILLTDADCYPSSPYWVACMVDSLSPKDDIVLGYGPLIKETSWINNFSRFETFFTAIQYLSYAHVGMPYMGVGRNLLFRKEVFINNNGYDSHRHIVSGDDDLFVQEVAQEHNTACCIDARSFMYSSGQSSLSSYIKQKKRHLNTSTSYKLKHKILLSILPFSLIVLYTLATVLTFSPLVALVFLVWVLRLIFIMIVAYRPTKTLVSQDLIYKYPMLEIFHIIYLFYFAPSAFNSKKHDWNG